MKIKKMIVTSMSVIMIFASMGVVSANDFETNSGSISTQIVDVNGVKDTNLEEFFTENQVPQNQQEILKEKVKNNELWDAYKPELANQIPSDFFELDPRLGDQEKYYRFPDGSFISISLSGGEMVPFVPFGSSTFGSSTDEYGTTFWDQKIEKKVGVVSAVVYADYLLTYPGNGYKSKIFKLYGADATGFGVTETPKTELIRPHEDLEKGRSALARSYWFSKADLSISWEGNGVNTAVGTTCSLWLGAIQGKLYADTKLPY